MKIFTSTLLIATLLLSCNSLKQEKSNSTKNDSVIMIDSDDQEMNAAIEKAKATFSNFDTAFKNGNFDSSVFLLKVRFITENGGEHIWANSLVNDNGNYYGTIEDDGIYTNKVKAGDRIKITLDNLSDWMYTDNDVLVGGYTIRTLRNKMGSKERAKFDSSSYYKILD